MHDVVNKNAIIPLMVHKSNEAIHFFHFLLFQLPLQNVQILLHVILIFRSCQNDDVVALNL